MSGLQVVRFPTERKVRRVQELIELAHAHARAAEALDPEYPHYPAEPAPDADGLRAQGMAAGLREAASELLKLVGEFVVCTMCPEPIIDPWNLAPDEDRPTCLDCSMA